MQSALLGRYIIFNKIIIFKTETLSKCSKVLSVRKEQYLKYAEFVLPSDTDDIHGFHMTCYRNFTALSKTQRENNKDIISNQHEQPTRITQSNLTSPTISSWAGIFPKVCLFCNKERKKIKERNKN